MFSLHNLGEGGGFCAIGLHNWGEAADLESSWPTKVKKQSLGRTEKIIVDLLI